MLVKEREINLNFFFNLFILNIFMGWNVKLMILVKDMKVYVYSRFKKEKKFWYESDKKV